MYNEYLSKKKSATFVYLIPCQNRGFKIPTHLQLYNQIWGQRIKVMIKYTGPTISKIYRKKINRAGNFSPREC